VAHYLIYMFLGNFVKIRSEIFQFIVLFTLHKLTPTKNNPWLTSLR